MNLNLLITKNKKIVITGATGWVGQNFLYELQRLIPQNTFNDIVIAFGSKDKVIRSTYYKIPIKIRIHALQNIEDILMDIKEIFLIHTAFVTREKLNILGFKKYIEINQNITDTIVDLIKNKNIAKSVVISSGAAELFSKKNQENKKLEKDPYGFLKLEEEKKISAISDALILRIYGLTGSFIRDPNIFAFGNFIISALNKKRIILNSKREVIRSYGFAGDIAKVGISWLNSNNISGDIINASTLKINLKDLATRISEIYSLPNYSSDINKNLDSDDYSCDSKKFKNLLSKFDFIEKDLDSQIIATYNYLNSNLKN